MDSSLWTTEPVVVAVAGAASALLMNITVIVLAICLHAMN